MTASESARLAFDKALERDAIEAEGKPRRNGDTVQTFSVADLMRMDLPEPRCVVPDLITEGSNILAGKSKLGKSWLALQLSLAVACGGVALGNIAVPQGDVLYLALEDTKRRLKSRFEKMLGIVNAVPPSNLHCEVKWKRQDKGGLADLMDWFDGHPAARFAVIDTYAKFKPARKRGGDCYEEDYQHGSEIKAVADRYGVGILSLAHCRKMTADDPLDSISGTAAIPGCADTSLVLRRVRGQADASLFVTGRDIDERDLALKWDSASCTWTALGNTAEYRISRERSEIIDLLRKEKRFMKPNEIAKILGKKPGTVGTMLYRMHSEGWLRNDGSGAYAAHEE
jgi:hypothetical protein